MKHTIHVHQQKMRKGQPAVIDRTYIRSTHHRRLEIICPCGCDEVAAVVVQSKVQDACGAHIWIEATKTSGDGPDAEAPILRLGADVHYTKDVYRTRDTRDALETPYRSVVCHSCQRQDRLIGAGVPDIPVDESTEFFISKGWSIESGQYTLCPEHQGSI